MTVALSSHEGRQIKEIDVELSLSLSSFSPIFLSFETYEHVICMVVGFQFGFSFCLSFY